MIRAIILDSENQTLHNFKIQNVGQRGGVKGIQEVQKSKGGGRETRKRNPVADQRCQRSKEGAVDENLRERWNLLHRELSQSCDSHPLHPHGRKNAIL